MSGRIVTVLIANLFLIVCIGAMFALAKEGENKVIGLSIGNTHWRAAVIRKGMVEQISDREGKVEHEIFPNINKIIGKNLKSIQYMDPYLLESNKNIFERNGMVYCKVETEEMTPEDIYSNILKEVKETTFEYLNENITGLFLSVPVHFGPDQRVAIRNAAEKQGLKIERFLLNPVNSAKANEYLNESKGKSVLVVDMEQRSLDVTVLGYEHDVYEVYSSKSEGQLGFESIHMRLIELFISKFKKQHPSLKNVNLFENQVVKELLLKQAQKAMDSLSNDLKYQITIPSLYDGKDFTYTLTLHFFEKHCKDILDDISKIIFNAITETTFYFELIDSVIVSPSLAKYPSIMRAITSRFPNEKIVFGQSPEIGAAIQASKAYQHEPSITKLFIAPFSIGIENSDHQLVKIIQRGDLLPKQKNVEFTNSEDFIGSSHLNIYIGESVNNMYNNIQIGELILEGIELTEMGNSRIHVSLQVDHNNVLKVSALDLKTTAHKETFIPLQPFVENQKLIDELIEGGLQESLVEDVKIEKGLSRYTPSNKKHDEL